MLDYISCGNVLNIQYTIDTSMIKSTDRTWRLQVYCR